MIIWDEEMFGKMICVHPYRASTKLKSLKSK